MDYLTAQFGDIDVNPQNRRQGSYEEVASFSDFEQAEHLIGYLEAREFPVEYATIVASGLHRRTAGVHLANRAIYWQQSAVLGVIAAGLGLVVGLAIHSILQARLHAEFLPAIAGVTAFAIFITTVIFWWQHKAKRPEPEPLKYEARFFDVVVHPQYATMAREIVATSGYALAVVSKARKLQRKLKGRERQQHRATAARV